MTATSVLRGLLFAGLAAVAAAPAAAGEEPAGPAVEAEAERAGQAAARLKALALARQAFVKVIFTPRWDEDCALEGEAREDNFAMRGFWSSPPGGENLSRLRHFTQLHREKRTSVVPGVILAPGRVVVADDGTGYEWRLVGRIEIEDAAGRRVPARFDGLVAEASALLFRAEGAEPKGTDFADDFSLSLATPPLGAALAPDPADPERWQVLSGGAALPFDAGPAEAGRLRFAPGGSGSRPPPWASGGILLLFDARGRPVGVSVGGTALDNANRAAWNPGEILAKGAIPPERVEQAESAARKTALGLHYKVRFEFRVEKGDEDDAPASRWMRGRNYFGGPEGAQDAEAFGLSVGGGRLFVPRTLRPQLLQTVERVSVQVDGEWKPARFLAAFEKTDGMLVEAPDAGIREPEGLYAAKGVDPLRPFVYCLVREKLGRTDALAATVRCLRRERGYGDRVRPDAAAVPPGALLFDMDGRLAGICVAERRDRELASLLGAGGFGYGRDDLRDLAAFEGLRAAFEKPAGHSVPAWRPMTKAEARRLVWLGVEFDPITRELARRLEVDGPTRGGTVGLMVSCVYPGSPAAELGIEAQDILLRLEVKGLGDPLPLLTVMAGAAESTFGRMGGMGLGGPAMGDGGVRTWKPRANVLTLLLTEAGPGRQAEIVYFSRKAGAVKTGAFRLDYGPVDYDSAEPYKDDRLGLSVKPLTYEVRRALALGDDDAGVIVSWVKQGSAAQLARLTPHMLVTQVEGQPVRSPEAFRTAVEKLRAGKKESVKLQVSAMGKSRFADLRLEE